ncbi:hypothetical protein [Candidatus Uabimicrobium sp. HlEnr_7]|uniref:hypothetical protein n=1 Tax=Candidatus Uabimicrobium helgolandensis TaxID=3095367 RepID=UPI0035592D57
MVKHVFVYLCIATFLWANDRSLHLAHNDILHSENRSLLSGEHYILKTFPKNEMISTYVTANEMSSYSSQKIYTTCSIEKKQSRFQLNIAHRFYQSQREDIRYSVHITEDSCEIKLHSSKDVRTLRTITKFSACFLRAETTPSFLVGIVTPLNNIAENLMPVTEHREYKKLKKSWKMVKKSGDNSIYIGSNGLKIVDYGVFATSKSKNVALARVKGSLVSDTLLKISGVQITYHGNSYWIKGEATLICQEKESQQ